MSGVTQTPPSLSADRARAQAASMQMARRPSGGRWMTLGHVGAPPPAADTLYLYWMPWPEDYAVTLLRTRCTAGGAGSAVKFGLWRDDPALGRPTGLPPIGQNAGLSTATSGTWQDLVVSSVRMGSPSGVWFGSVYTGTLPQMICNTTGGPGVWATPWPVGGMPTVPRNNFGVAQPYANDIMALNLTGVGLSEQGAAVPAYAVEWV
jgi:hypothetical protein